MEETTEMFQQLNVETPDRFESKDVHMSSGVFTCFPKLPKELRLEIWCGTLPAPRQFVLEGPDAHAYYSGFPNSNRPEFVTLPASLHVDHESRTEALKHLTCFFVTSSTLGFKNCNPRSTFFPFNPHLDSLYLDAKFWKFSRSETLELDTKIVSAAVPNSSVRFSRTIRFLEIECDFWNNYHTGLIFGDTNVYNNSLCKGILPWFPKIQRLNLRMMDNGHTPANSAMMHHSKDLYQQVSKGFLLLQRKYADYQIPELFIYDGKGQQTWSPDHHLKDSLVVPAGK